MTTPAAKATEVAPKKMRSPQYPAIGMREAIEKIGKVYEQAKRAPVSERSAVSAMGYGALSGSARVVLSALRKYGLLDDQGSNVRVSDLALRILVHPEGSAERGAAIREAAFKPELIKELAPEYGPATDEMLRPLLIVEKKFSDAGADQFISAFRETLALVARLDSGYDPGMTTPAPAPSTGVAAAPAGMNRLPQPSQPQGQGRLYSWPLDDDTTAEVRIVGSQVSRDHLDALIEYLEVAKKRLSERKAHDTT